MNCDYKPQAKILQAFQMGMTLTVNQARRLAGTTELRRVVSRLRRQGYPIKSFRKPGESFVHYYMDRALMAKGTSIDKFNQPTLSL